MNLGFVAAQAAAGRLLPLTVGMSGYRLCFLEQGRPFPLPRLSRLLLPMENILHTTHRLSITRSHFLPSPLLLQSSTIRHRPSAFHLTTPLLSLHLMLPEYANEMQMPWRNTRNVTEAEALALRLLIRNPLRTEYQRSRQSMEVTRIFLLNPTSPQAPL